ncbi:MAG: hypothetical protein QW429_01485 [Thermoprotei archaeon]
MRIIYLTLMSQREIREKRIQVLKNIAIEDLEKGAQDIDVINHLYSTARLNWTLSIYAARDISKLAFDLAKAELERKGEKHE